MGGSPGREKVRQIHSITLAMTQATGSGAEAPGGSMPRVRSKLEITSLRVLSVPSLTK